MEITNHNIRQVLTSSDLVIQTHRGELLHGQGVAPGATVPEKPGDTTKVVLSKEAENLKNDLQKKNLKDPNQQKKKEKGIPAEDSQELVTPILDVGVNLDVNG